MTYNLKAHPLQLSAIALTTTKRLSIFETPKILVPLLIRLTTAHSVS